MWDAEAIKWPGGYAARVVRPAGDFCLSRHRTDTEANPGGVPGRASQHDAGLREIAGSRAQASAGPMERIRSNTRLRTDGSEIR